MEIKARQKHGKTLNVDINTGKILKKSATTNIQEKQAIIYCRVSTDKQVTEGHGLESQEWICRKRCETNGVRVVWVFLDEWISGAIIERPGINNAISFLQKENKTFVKVRYFICTEESRISRADNLMDTLMLDTKIRETGVDIIYTFGNVDTSTDEWKLLNQFKFIIASEERKRIKKRAITGKVERLRLGYWPFPWVPVGYKKVKQQNKSVVEIDEIKWPIIKKGLELYANDIIQTQSDLHKYRKDCWLTTSEARYKGKLYFSFIGKTLDIQRLYFYAGYIVFPIWDINEPVEAQHMALITLDTVQKIIKKAYSPKAKFKKKTTKEKECFILRWCIKCPDCWYTISCRHSKNWQWKQYAYYGCCSRKCPNRANLPQENFESEFKIFLTGISIPAKILEVFERIILGNIENKKADEAKQKSLKKGRIIQIENRMKEIEDFLPKAKIAKLYEILENERANLDQEKIQLQEQLQDNDYGEKSVKDLLEKVKGIFINPLAFWELGNEDMRQLLLIVRFGDKLYHTKKQGFRTKENAGLHQHFKGICTSLVPSKAIDGSIPELFNTNLFVMLDALKAHSNNISTLFNWFTFSQNKELAV